MEREVRHERVLKVTRARWFQKIAQPEVVLGVPR
jgi:hypothetical protein